jgi:hypothetical protein
LWLEWAYIKRAEAVALLKELGAEHLIQPSYQMERFLKKNILEFEEYSKGYLCIFKL